MPALSWNGPASVSVAAPSSDAARVPVAVVPRSRPLIEEGGDDLAPDPFVEAPTPIVHRWGPMDEDDLAPDPFADRRQKLQPGVSLAEDDLAPDPFAEPRREVSHRLTKPLAEDGLAPDPFAEPAR